MPHSPLRCTMAVLCCNVAPKSRGVRGWVPGNRQFVDPAIEKADLRPRRTFDGERSSKRCSRERVPSTSRWRRLGAKYCVGCRTRQKERKQRFRQQRESTWPPRYSHYCFTHSVAQNAIGATSEPITSKDLPTVSFCLADLGYFRHGHSGSCSAHDQWVVIRPCPVLFHGPAGATLLLMTSSLSELKAVTARMGSR